jgi:MFS family permease
MTDDCVELDPESMGRFAAFGYRDFRLFWTGLFLSNIGTWMQMTAVSWLLYKLTSSPLQLGINGLFRAVPVLGLGIISGTFADRYDRKTLMLTTQSLLAMLALLLGVLDHTENIEPWHIYSVTFLSAAVGSFDGPSRQALFPSLVPRSALPNAVALNSILWKGPALIGPTLGGIAISLMGTSGAFYTNAASFLFVIVALLQIRSPSPAPRQDARFGKDFTAGLTYIYSQKVILGVIVMEATSSVFGLDNAMLTIFASDVLVVGAHGFGLFQSARGLGAMIGSSLFIAIGQRAAQGKILLTSALFYGVAFALFGLSPSFVASLILLSFVGVADAIWAAGRSTILQWLAPDRLRGRVMGIFQLANQGLNPLGQMETGVIVPLIGAREATFFGGMIVCWVAMLTAWRIPDVPKFRLLETRAHTSNSTPKD